MESALNVFKRLEQPDQLTSQISIISPRGFIGRYRTLSLPFSTDEKKPESLDSGFFLIMAEWTGLEPATPGVTGRYSNQLNYHSAVSIQHKCNLLSLPFLSKR